MIDLDKMFLEHKEKLEKYLATKKDFSTLKSSQIKELNNLIKDFYSMEKSIEIFRYEGYKNLLDSFTEYVDNYPPDPSTRDYLEKLINNIKDNRHA